MARLTDFLFLSLAMAVIAGNFSCSSQQREEKKTGQAISGDLIIFHAGSLSVPFREIAKSFNAIYPEVKVLAEAAGSVASARKITELNRPCDIMASADYKVIDNLLMPEFADWNIKFAGNEMVIVFNEKSKYAGEIDSSNWYRILLRDDVIFGRSDPEQDPCGYRAVLTIKLSGIYYHDERLPELLLKKDINYIRPKEVDLLALLETNTIDYCFNYKSVALQHQLPCLILPDQINLKNPAFFNFYLTVSTQISGQTPDEKITQRGEPMVYGITILRDAPNYSAALAFIKFLLEKDHGMKLMEENGQTIFVPALTNQYEIIPDELKNITTQEINE